jgi:hypothetical protein
VKPAKGWGTKERAWHDFRTVRAARAATVSPRSKPPQVAQPNSQPP